MKTRQRIRKDDSAAKATHRLTEIEVNEVSVVDRGANQRTYLVVKDDKKAEASGAADKAGEVSAPPPPPTPPTTPTPPTLHITAELQKQVIDVLKAAQERIGVIAKVVEGASVTPGAPTPPELVTALNQVASLFKTFAGAPPAPAAPPGPATPGGSATQPAKADATSDTEKAGRRFSAATLEQLQAMQSTLSALLSDPPATAAEPESAPEGQESAEKSAAPSAEIVEIQATLAGLVAAVGKMTEVFEGQNQRIDSLAKSRGNSQQVDLDNPREPARKAKVVWDLDMAAPLKAVQ